MLTLAKFPPLTPHKKKKNYLRDRQRQQHRKKIVFDGLSVVKP